MYRNAVLIVSVVLILGTAGNTFGQSGPQGWWSETIGAGSQGSAVQKGDTFEVTGNGADIWNNADGFHYLYKQLTGDGSMVARVATIGAGSNTWAKGGVMIRQSNAAGSTHGMMVITANSDGTAGNGASFQWRPTADGASSNSDSPSVVAPPYWAKIERVGNSLSGYISADGQTWTQLGSATTITMTDPVLIGLCVTSHASGELRTFTFDNVSFTGAVADKPPQLKAYNPDPASGTEGADVPLFSWTPGETAVFHNIYFGTTPDLTEADLVAPNQPFAMYFHVPGLEPGVTYYWRVDEVEADGVTVHTGDVWTVMATPTTAFAPSPADEARDIFPGVSLRWAAGQQAMQHQVYFGTSFADVNDGAAAADKGLVDQATFSPGVLRASTTYYWRVDEIQADGAVNRGPVWSFTTEAGVAGQIMWQWWSDIGGTALSALTGSPNYPHNPSGSELVDLFESDVDWADNYGQRLYGWLIPPETGEYTFWISGDDAQELSLSTDADPANAVVIARVTSWTASREWEKEAGQKSAPITLQAGQKYYIQALGKEGGGGDSTAVAWQGPGIAARDVIAGQYVDTFALPPLQAFNPNPVDGAVDAPQAPVLSWSAGDKAAQHDVYFGDDAAAVAAADTSSPLYKGQQTGATFNPGALEWNKTYYWRVDEVNPAEAESPWTGSVWSFTTANFIAVEDFESYTDDEGGRIYETWIDGWTNGSGSVVGYLEAPFAEQTIVHGGKQSMPLDYNNIDSPFYSETMREFATAQDWTANGVTDLSLWFRGNPVAFVETAPGAFTISGAGHDIWDNADDFRFAYQRLSGDGSIVVKVESIVNTNNWAKGGVMIRESLDAGSSFAYVVVTPAQGVSFGRRLIPNDTCASTTQAGIPTPQWVKLTRTGNVFTAQYSADGTAWTDFTGTDGAPVAVTIGMLPDVYVGLAVTSHDATRVTTAEFSGAATTGGVTGAWQVAEIGDDPQPGNSPESLYVVVEDSAGKTAVAVNPDPAAVTTTTWTEWKVPLSDLAGVNLASVKVLSIGVGDRANPTAGGTGMVYFDDIRVVKPEPVEEPNAVETP